MQRGFKTKAEQIACDLRVKLGLRAHSPLPAKKLIAYLDVLVIQPAEIPGLKPELIHEMQNGSSEQWSAITFYDARGNPFIIHNPTHAPTRQESDLMHEAAHIICKHPPGQMLQMRGLNFRSYNDTHEEEAKWLGACLQISRRGLLWAIGQRMTTEQMSEHFCASPALVRYRRNMTGVDTQMMRFRRATRSA
jgi:Zn-dependent peptidase ImmA (M78 family)